MDNDLNNEIKKFTAGKVEEIMETAAEIFTDDETDEIFEMLLHFRTAIVEVKQFANGKEIATGAFYAMALVKLSKYHKQFKEIFEKHYADLDQMVELTKLFQ